MAQEVIRRRFVAGQRNFEQTYRALVNAWAIYDNSGTNPVLMDAGVNTQWT